MKTMRLRHLASVTNSNVDKVADPSEIPVRLCNYVDVYKNNFIHADLELSAGSASKTEIERFRLRVDDVIITKDSEDRLDIGIPAYVRETANDIVCGYHLSLLRRKPDIMRGDFLFWSLQSIPAKDQFSNAAYGITRYGLTLSGIKSIILPCPDLPTQKAIADFLDRESARIDQLIEKKQRLTATLTEKINATVDHLVSRGLNRSASMHVTGIPWLPRVPAHWSIRRAKYLYREAQRQPLENDRVITAFRDGQVTLRENRRTEGFTFAIKEVGYQHIKRGDLVIHSMDAFAGAIGVSDADGKATGEYAVCEAQSSEVNNRYYAHVLRYMSRKNYIYVLCPSVRERAPRFRFVRFASVRLPVPPRTEQDDIVRYIHETTAKGNAVGARTKESITKLQELRAALVTAAVSGQLDVETWGKRGETDRRLDAIEEDLAAPRAEARA